MLLPSAFCLFLLCCLSAAAAADLKDRRIPNALIVVLLLPGFLTGPVFFPRLFAVLFLLLPLWLAGLLGAGDVKLLSAVAALTGSTFFLPFLLLSLLSAAVPAIVLRFSGSGGRKAFLPLAPFFVFGLAETELLAIAAPGLF